MTPQCHQQVALVEPLEPFKSPGLDCNIGLCAWVLRQWMIGALCSEEAFSLVQEREEWLQQLQEIEERQRALYVEEQQRMEFFEAGDAHFDRFG